MDAHLHALRSSADRLRDLVAPLDDTQLEQQAFPSEWTIADVLSHVGSGAVIMQRRFEDSLVRQPTPDDFGPVIWDAWNAKSPREKADDALIADRALVERIESLTDEERSGFEFAVGARTLDAIGFTALRLNEHVMHTWDIDVALHPAATLPLDAAALVVDNLDLIARYTAKPTGSSRTIVVRTSDPTRDFTITLDPEAVTVERGADGREPVLGLPAEAFARLIYGRLDAQHTPSVEGDASALDELRQVYSGP
jgi:uncharacterized protein (TIGR03083 family)